MPFTQARCDFRGAERRWFLRRSRRGGCGMQIELAASCKIPPSFSFETSPPLSLLSHVKFLIRGCASALKICCPPLTLLPPVKFRLRSLLKPPLRYLCCLL